MNKKVAITHSKYRALLSEVLPYELPLIFSNNDLYAIAQRYKVKIDKNNRLYSTTSDKGIKILLRLLSGTSDKPKKSYLYKIRKSSEGEIRSLTLIHPLMQFRVTYFYEKYKELIIYFCGKSNYSIRYPYKEAQYMRQLKRFLPDNIAEKEVLKGEQEDAQKHFFAYKRYQNINGFFEDYKYQRAEKKFPFMLRTDLKHCFDNIIPQNLSRAVFGVDTDKSIFTGLFTEMQIEMFEPDKTNDKKGETEKHGILIGPEFSRIFTELILQEIDRKVELKMIKEKLYIHSDYEFFRYVDDGFLFYKNSMVKTIFMSCYMDELTSWKLSINSKKLRFFPCRPFFDKVTIAKRSIQLSFEKMFENRLNTLKGLSMANEDWYDVPFKTDSRYVIQDIKTVLVENDVELCNISSKILTCLQYKLVESIKDFNNIYVEYIEAEKQNTIDATGRKIASKYETSFVEFAREIIDICFYILNCDMRMSASIKVVTILETLIKYFIGKYFIDGQKCCIFSTDNQMIFYKSLHDELKQVLSQNTYEASTSLEIINLMLLQNDLPICLRAQDIHWEKYFGLDTNGEFPKNLNFMIILSMLHILQRSDCNNKLDRLIRYWIIQRLKEIEKDVDDITDSTEGLYLLVSILTAPFIDDKYKDTILKFTYLTEEEKQELIVAYEKGFNIFVKWKDFSLFKASKMKSSSEVY